jgi:hypothetical protein
MDKADRRIEELSDELDLLSQIEEQARARLDGEDEAWNADKKHTIEKMFNLVCSVKDSDPAHKAVYILGQLLAEVEKLRAPKRIVSDLANKRKLLIHLREQRARHGESLAAAKEAYDAHKAGS